MSLMLRAVSEWCKEGRKRRLTLPVSSPGLTGRSSKHRPWILDCQSKSDASDFDHLVSAEVGQARLRVKPGNDSLEDINPIEIRSSERTSALDVAGDRRSGI